MSIIDTIVSALRSLGGGGGTDESAASSESTGPGSEGQVSVEHEPDASTEAAVKGGDAEPGGTDGSDSGDGDDEAAAAGTDAAASTGTLVDEDAGREPAETVGEAGGVDVDRTTDETGVGGDESSAESDESGDPTETATNEDAGNESETAADDEPATGSTESVETITGIGPAYAGRLSEFGIETVGGLAAADAAEVAEGIDVSESRVSDWIERANDAS